MTEQPTSLIPFLARNCLIGVLTGWIVLAGLLLADVARLRGLLFSSDQWALTLVMAAASFGATFGSLAMGTAIFMLPRERPGRED